MVDTQDNEIHWEDPPLAYGRSKLFTFRQQLIANPGRWAMLTDGDNPTKRMTGHHYQINNSKGAWRGYRWEAVTRNVDGEARLYVRCLGPEDES